MKINGEKVNLVDDLYGGMIWKKVSNLCQFNI